MGDSKNTFLNNIKSFINLKVSEDDDVTIKIIGEISNSLSLLRSINDLVIEEDNNKSINELRKIFEDYELKMKYYNLNNNEVIIKTSESFLDVKIIEANNVKDNNILSKSFNEVMKYYINKYKKILMIMSRRLTKKFKKIF